MSFKNSLKLLASNFSVVWKHLVYMLILSLLTIGLVLLCAGPCIDCLRDNGWTNTASSLISTIYTKPMSIFNVIKEIAISFFKVLALNFPSIWFSVIGLIFAGYLIPAYLTNLGGYNIASITYQKMTTLLDVGYTQNFVSCLKPASRYAFVRTIVRIPFDFCRVFFVLFLFSISTSFITNLLFLSLLSGLLILISALENIVCAGIAPSMFEKGISSLKAPYTSIRIVFKNFNRNFGSSIILVLFCIFINVFMALFTAFAGLIITIPATYVFAAFFSNVVYLSSTNQRYYLYPSVIVNPAVENPKSFNDRNFKIDE